MFTPLPALPYSVPDLRRLCRRITRHTGEVDCAGVRVGVKKVEPFVTTPGWYIGPHLHSYYEAHILLAGGAENVGFII